MATGFIKFDADHTVYVDLDTSTEEVEKAVIIDSEGNETPIGGGAAYETCTVSILIDETNPGGINISVPYIDDAGLSSYVYSENDDVELTVPIIADVVTQLQCVTGKIKGVTGDCEKVDDYTVSITGDGTVTVENALA